MSNAVTMPRPSEAASYYVYERREIEPLLPEKLGRVLDVGCGAGVTLKWLKQVDPECETTGVEPNPALADALSKNADHVHISPISEALSKLGTYDTILCLDVLEHLIDSDAVLAALAEKLAPDGRFIVSLPNVAHHSVSLPLLFKRQFDYAEAGILDRTHVRFFVEKSIYSLFNSKGLYIVAGRVNGVQPIRWKLLDMISLGYARHYLTTQYIFQAVKGEGPQKKIHWHPAPRITVSSR